MPRRIEFRCRWRALRDDAGFTMVETVVGLGLLMVVLAIFALFLMPLMVRGPELSVAMQTTLEVEQFQAQCLVASRELRLPPWWPEGAVECNASGLRIHDLGYRFTTSQEPRGVLLEIVAGADGLSLSWKGLTMRYRHITGATVTLAQKDGQAPDAAVISIPTATTPFVVTLPLRSTAVPHAEQ